MGSQEVIEIIKEERKRQGLSQYRLAQMCGITREMVNNLEKGKNSPTLRTIAAMLQALGLEMVVKKGEEDAAIQNQRTAGAAD